MKHLSSFNNFNADVKSSFLELEDLGFTIYSKEDLLIKVNGSLLNASEFVIYRRGKSGSGYSIDGRDIDLFNIEEDTMEYLLRFSDMCKLNNLKYRIISSDGEFTADITNKLYNIDSVNKYDILDRTHLNFKKNKSKDSELYFKNSEIFFDFKNVKFVSCQVFK